MNLRPLFMSAMMRSLHDMNSDRMESITIETFYWVLALEK